VNVVLLPQAKADLAEITDPLLSRVIKRLQSLRNYPELGGAMTSPLIGYRSTVVAYLRIVYRVSGETVLVSYVRHCRFLNSRIPRPA